MTVEDIPNCKDCNGHGFSVKDQDSHSLYDVFDTDQYRAPSDKEAENDCSDLDPITCKNCNGGWSTPKS